MTVSQSSRTLQRASERGNVLFLILIAVALFAALSYAVTQSTRSGGGDASKETNLVNAAGVTQYPASIKTAITRMVVSNGTGANDLLFNTPSSFATALTTATLQSQAVFYPTGGGATYVEAPANVMANNALGTWHFNGENQVVNIGTTTATTDATSADIIAFLPGVKKAVCDSIHSKLGLTQTYTPALTGIDVTRDMNVATPNIFTGGGTGKITSSILDGQPQGCFMLGADYIYYHVIVER